ATCLDSIDYLADAVLAHVLDIIRGIHAARQSFGEWLEEVLPGDQRLDMVQPGDIGGGEDQTAPRAEQTGQRREDVKRRQLQVFQDLGKDDEVDGSRREGRLLRADGVRPYLDATLPRKAADL